MDSKDLKQEAADKGSDNKGDKGRQNVLLMVLLAMVGGFSYLYFFTDVIRTQEESKPAAPPVAQVVKQPLPPRDSAAAKPEAKPDAKPAGTEQKPADNAVKAEPAKPAAAPAPAAPVAAAQPKPKEEPKKAEPAKPADKKVAVAEKKPAVAEKKPAVADKKTVADAKKPEAKAAATAASGPWTVLVGSYVLENSLATDQGKIKKAGLEPVIKPGERKKTVMNRLLLAEFKDRESAKAELEKLRKHTSDAFILDHAGKHYVYAGSYLLDSRASSEKERLGAAGFALSLKREEVSIPSKVLTAGVFTDKKTAEAAVKKLKDAGIKATLK
jgi:cell division protein FtsN